MYTLVLVRYGSRVVFFRSSCFSILFFSAWLFSKDDEESVRALGMLDVDWYVHMLVHYVEITVLCEKHTHMI